MNSLNTYVLFWDHLVFIVGLSREPGDVNQKNLAR